MLLAFATLVLFQLAGEFLARWLDLPLPGAVVGMILLFVALVIRGQAPAPLRRVASGLLQHLMLLLIPIVSGVVMHTERVMREWWPFLVSNAVGGAITLAVTAIVLRAMLGRKGTDNV
ncbi:CidA/LrgA family protein [Pigmentiphaga aceris]|uniref:CidA/LrgA family protein n=1 Tax=Pigmentiphaga aceris TaxID=1940612 RepID=A0A5C0B5F8_9BURK|nr:CidA/LrgA family protein [Pigmentiphaga aceris]QEI09136.1 CidA/LrgA family protein [Pigmentiphaga aceris]